jgi:predicted phosphodiesterase
LKRTGGALSLGMNPQLRFGLVADMHYARAEILWNRYFDQSKTKLTDAINFFNKEDLDFIIELGDLKDEGNPPDMLETIDFLVEIEKVFSGFKGPVYHVLGNHDMDSISKDDFLSRIKNFGQEKARNYYSFDKGGIKFLVLDPNYNEDGSEYNKGNFDWTSSVVPPDQVEWLKAELSDTRLPVIVFIHQLIDSFSGIPEDYCVNNAVEIVRILGTSGKVVAVFQGHYHNGHYSFRNGIHYYTMKAMVEGSLPENNSYAIVEIDNHLNIMVSGFQNCESNEMKYRKA